MSDNLSPLSPDVLAALALEARRRGPDVAQLSGTAARIAASIDTMAALPQAGPAPAGASVAASSALPVAKLAAVFALGLGLGGAGGAALYARLATAEPTRSPAVATVVAPPAPVDVPEAPLAPQVVPAPKEAAPAKPRSPQRVPDSELERLLVERAAVALGRGNAQEALAACDEHQRRFAEGELVEERESIAIRALVTRGDLALARARAAVFHRRFPSSMQGALIDDVTDSGTAHKNGAR